MPRDRLLNTFGRRIGKRLGQESRDVITNILPKYLVNCAELAQHKSKLYLEIGFGTGDFLLEYAKNNHETLCVGCDPFLNGVAGVVKKIVAHEITNIKIWPDDVRLIFAQLPDQIFDIIYILFPDPWPKRKQHQRRLINNEFLIALYQKMKPGAQLNIATDHADYANWIESCLQNNPVLFKQNTANEFADVSMTRYYKRAASFEHLPHFFKLIKNGHSRA